MKGFPVLLAMLLVSGALALAQVNSPAYTVPMGSAVTVPTVVYPVGVALPTAATPAVSSNTAALINELEAIRGQILASQLTLQGQTLTSRMNALMSQEMALRQAIASNPNLPNAQWMALQLNAEANALNRDIAAFTTTLSMVPAAQRPYVAQQVNTFDVAYWQPTMQQFSAYTASLPMAMTSYQPAFAANPWLQPWLTNYHASVMSLSQTPQVFASVRWWTQPTTVVLGSTEVFPSTTFGGFFMLPNGAVIYIPPSVAATIGTAAGTPGITATTPNIDGTAY